MERLTVLSSLNDGLHTAFASDERVHLLGEDVLDPYGGAFKVSRGLSNAYPQRVWSSPISEAGIVGIATGMAMRGLRPVVEIMFGDFLTLAADQIVNHATKFTWMYNGSNSNPAVSLPLVVRTPMGGRRGYGPTHSQTLEKMFLGVPGLRVVAPDSIAGGDNTRPGDLLANAILHESQPVLFIENKLQYLLPVQTKNALSEWDVSMLDGQGESIQIGTPVRYPAYVMKVRGASPASLTLTAYGYMAELARQAVLRLAYEYEIFAELVTFTQLSPFWISPLLQSCQKTGGLLAIEEGTATLGWGAEILARIAEASPSHMSRLGRLAAKDTPVPASRPLEEAVLPGVESIIQASIEMTNRGKP